MAEKLYSENSKKHNHDMPCPHNLLFCTPCDEVYCTICEEVFTSKPCTENHYPWWNFTCGTCSTGTTTETPYITTVTYPGDGANSASSNDVSFSFPPSTGEIDPL